MVAIVAATMPASAEEPPYTPKGPIEATYSALGPWDVSVIKTTTPCDRKGNLCTVLFPADLGSNPLTGQRRGFKHPVIVWANGTGVPTTDYNLILQHWASWGFVIVASDDGSTALGESTVDAAEFIVAQSQERSSAFFHKIDRRNIGVSGHSQGGYTAIELFARRPDLFKTSIPWNATTFGAGPAFGGANVVDLSEVTAGSIFFMGGGFDPLGNSALQLVDYEGLPDTVGKAIGSVTYAGHDSLVKVPECTAVDCVAARGYSTAWMMWKLQGVDDVAAAFAPGTGEFSSSHPDWAFAMSNGK